MRTLKFIVDNQIIKPDPNCDFNGLVPGTEGYVKIEFCFSSEWNDCNKVAAFFSQMGKEYQPQIIKDDSCIIPDEALKKRRFKIQLIGSKQDYKITTNKIVIKQDGGICNEPG